MEMIIFISLGSNKGIIWLDVVISIKYFNQWLSYIVRCMQLYPFSLLLLRELF